jgi:hypothetical protein
MSKHDPQMADRAIVLQALNDEHPDRWTPAELGAALPDFDPLAVENAVEELLSQGVLERTGPAGEHVRASRCARKLDALGLVGI